MLKTIATIGWIISMMVVPPLAGIEAYNLWLTYTTLVPALLSGAWAAVIVAAVIKELSK